MIKLYTAPTPNGRKISILLEELKVEYKCILVNLDKKEQFKKNFSKISPTNKIPVIEDCEHKKIIGPTCSSIDAILFRGIDSTRFF